MARFGVNVPAYLAQLLFGTGPGVYHVVPIAAFTLQMVFTYLLARHLAGRATGVLAALIMIFFTGMNRNASQLLPDGMVGTVAVMGGYALVRYHEASGAQARRWLVAVGLCCIWAYAIKESSVLLFPGFGLAILLSKRSWKDALLFSAMLAVYALLETAGFRAFTQYAHRLAIVNEEHGQYPPTTFFGLFERFAKLGWPWGILFYAWVVAAVADVRSGDKRRHLLLLVAFGYVFFLTFLVRGIDPVMQWMAYKYRYMSPAGPFFILSIALALHDVARRVWSKVGPKLTWAPLRALSGSLATHPASVTLALCSLLGVVAFVAERPYLDKHPLPEMFRHAAILNDAFRRNLPIVQRAPVPRGLYTIYQVHLQPEYLVQSDLGDGRVLPDTKEGVRFLRSGKRYAYVLRDKSAYEDRKSLQRMIKQGCAVVITTPKSRLTLNVKRSLPKRCRAPKGGVLPP